MKWLAWAVGIFGAQGVILAIAWFFIVPMLAMKDKPSEVSVPAKEAPAAKPAGKAKVTPKAPVTVYGPSAPARLKLPPDVKPTEHVIAATQVRGSDRPQTITTTLDTETGESRSFVKQDAYPWVSFESRGEVRLQHGLKQGGLGNPRQITRLSVNYDAVRLKAITVGVGATIDSDSAKFVGIGIAYRW